MKVVHLKLLFLCLAAFSKQFFYQKVTTTTAFPPFLLLAFSGRGAILLLSNVDSIIAVYLSSKLKKSHARLKKRKKKSLLKSGSRGMNASARRAFNGCQSMLIIDFSKSFLNP